MKLLIAVKTLIYSKYKLILIFRDFFPSLLKKCYKELLVFSKCVTRLAFHKVNQLLGV